MFFKELICSRLLICPDCRERRIYHYFEKITPTEVECTACNFLGWWDWHCLYDAKTRLKLNDKIYFARINHDDI